jgi:small subunit ribosomal protein S17
VVGNRNSVVGIREKGGIVLESDSRRTLTGIVVSDKMDKTVVVAVENYYRHSLYNKIVKKTKKYKAHDEQNQCRMGDKVRITETRPLSKEKRWRVAQIIEKAPMV